MLKLAHGAIFPTGHAGYVNRHAYGRAARVIELAVATILFAAFVMLLGAVLGQLL